MSDEAKTRVLMVEGYISNDYDQSVELLPYYWSLESNPCNICKYSVLLPSGTPYDVCQMFMRGMFFNRDWCADGTCSWITVREVQI